MVIAFKDIVIAISATTLKKVKSGKEHIYLLFMFTWYFMVAPFIYMMGAFNSW